MTKKRTSKPDNTGWQELGVDVVNAGKPKDPLAAWWEEEAERTNRMGEMARAMGIVISTDDPGPPELDEDGTMVDRGNDGFKPLPGQGK